MDSYYQPDLFTGTDEMPATKTVQSDAGLNKIPCGQSNHTSERNTDLFSEPENIWKRTSLQCALGTTSITIVHIDTVDNMEHNVSQQVIRKAVGHWSSNEENNA